ncbi:hypothetical protein ACFL2U_02910 [Patescibacteria group bacterium]
MKIDVNQVFTGGCEIVFVDFKNQTITNAHVSLADQPLATFIEVAMTEKNIKASNGLEIVFFDKATCKMRVQVNPDS